MFGNIEADKLWFALFTAVVVALLNHFQQGRVAQLERRSARLRDQLQNLYGPLLYYAEDNFHYFERNEQIGTNYMGLSTSPDLDIDDRLAATDSGAVLREIEKHVTHNNARMVRLMRQNYAFIDIDDVPTFRKFVATHFRPTIEREMPAVMLALETQQPAWWQPDVSKRIKSRFERLTTDLDTLSQPFWRRWLWKLGFLRKPQLITK